MDLQKQLQDIFGLDEFRPAQQLVIEQILSGRDVLCVMPTGAGKSLCYQFPAAVNGAITLVISPLISLMEDQVQQMRDEGIAAAMLNSSMTPAMQRQVIAELNEGFEGLLYVAPERLFSSNFAPVLQKLKVALLAVDEAHCISQWGHDFRPEYSRIGEVRELLGRPPTIALTATATAEVRKDIVANLNLTNPEIVVTGFDRPTLIYESHRIEKGDDRDGTLIAMMRAEAGSCIVYCATRKAVDEVTGMLAKALPGRPVYAYHAGMDPAARTSNQDRFMQKPAAIAVATNAFGMGINKPDIRMVVHYNLTGTLEQYYQEAGRAGRDGLPARCVMLFAYQDRYTQEFFIEKLGDENSSADPKTIEKRKIHATKKLELMIQYASSHKCRRKMILDYFGDQMPVENCNCDVCGRGSAPRVAATFAVLDDDVITAVRQILSAVARCRGKFGVGVVAEMLAGSSTDQIRKWQLDALSTFGLMEGQPAKRIIAMLHRLLEAGLVRQRDPDGVRFRPVVELTAAGISVMKGDQQPPTSLADLLPRRRRRSERENSRPRNKFGARNPVYEKDDEW
jgi:ATP-dependent DNA helicase RecQ